MIPRLTPIFDPARARRCATALLLGFVARLAAAPAPPPADVAPPSLPAAIVDDPAQDPAWRDLFAQLAQPQARVSRFEERRYFPFRSSPIVLRGEIRLLPGHGLSLHYFGTRAQTVIVDAQGVLLRDEQGRQQSAPHDARAQAATTGLFEVLRFDVPSLRRDFAVHAARTGEHWTLGFVPRDTGLRNLLGSILVQGEASTLHRIDLVRSEKQRIEILLGNTLEDVIFPPDVVKQFFR